MHTIQASNSKMALSGGEITCDETEDAELPPCLVCGCDSSGCHFGVVNCESCKVFFRRSLIRKPNYKCNFEEKCAIRPVKKQNCSSCRLKKCLQVGMSKEGVKKGRYSVARKINYTTMKTNSEIEKTQKELEAKLYQHEIKDIVDRVCALHAKYQLVTKENLEKIQAVQDEKLAYHKALE